MIKSKFFIGVCLVLQTLIFVAGCKKRDDIISQDGGLSDGLYRVDTFSIHASSISEHDIRTDNLSQQLCGIMHDPLTGISSATLFTQLSLASISNVITVEDDIDSAYLILALTSEITQYGNISSEQEFTVYELEDMLLPAGVQAYNSHDSVAHFPTPVGSFKGSINYTDSVPFLNRGQIQNAAPGIKITLTKEFALKLISGSADDVKTQADFKNYVRGLCIKPSSNPQSGEGAVVAFNLNSQDSRAFVYFDSDKQAQFNITDQDVKFVRYQYRNQPASLVFQKENPDLHFDTTYVQALTGAKTHFRFPSLFNAFRNNRVFIHKAEIVIPVLEATTSDLYPAPRRLLIVQPDLDRDNRNADIPDFGAGGQSYGGIYNEDKKSYTFGITQYIQFVIRAKENSNLDFNNGLFLVNTIDQPITPARALLDTRQDAPFNERIKLIVTYSKL